MAFFEWDMTSITSVTTTLVETGARGSHYYGTLFGVAGTWIKLPDSAPPIDDIVLSVGLLNGNDGLYFVRGTSSGGAGMFGAVGQRVVKTGLEIAGFQRGGRWMRLDRAATAFPVKMTVGATKKKFQLYYRSVNEVVAGRAPTNG